jgi:hypothetical protein
MRETADLLGVSKEAIRKRVVRGTLRSELGEDGRRYVCTEAGGDAAAAEAPTHERDVLISEMVEELHDLLRAPGLLWKGHSKGRASRGNGGRARPVMR